VWRHLGFARKLPFVFTGWFWFAGMLVPVIGLVQVGSQSMADRYAYLPVAGLLVILVWGLAMLVARWKVSNALAAAAAFFDSRRLRGEDAGATGLLAERRHALRPCAGRDPKQLRCQHQSRRVAFKKTGRPRRRWINTMRHCK